MFMFMLLQNIGRMPINFLPFLTVAQSSFILRILARSNANLGQRAQVSRGQNTYIIVGNVGSVQTSAQSASPVNVF
jgi:hypothetical protein